MSARRRRLHIAFQHSPCVLLALLGAGCGRPQAIGIDLSSGVAEFRIHHEGWPAPLWWPRVTEFAIASEEDGALWQLESETTAGLRARDLMVRYGQTPAGFRQLTPEANRPPKALEAGRTYFVAAGGPRSLYRMVFSLPVDARGQAAPSSRPAG